MRYTIALGNDSDGAKFYGIFETESEASKHADFWFEGEEWHIVSITTYN